MIKGNACVNHFDRVSRVNLDGDELCQECADAWVRGEGQHAAWLEAQELEAATLSSGAPTISPTQSVVPRRAVEDEPNSSDLPAPTAEVQS